MGNGRQSDGNSSHDPLGSLYVYSGQNLYSMTLKYRLLTFY